MLHALSAPRAEARSRNAITLEEIEHPLVRKALEIWHTARGKRAMPAKTDLGPRALLPLLKNIALLKVLGGGEEFVFRVVGDQIRLQQGADMQGKTMAEIDAMLPGHGSVLRRIYKNAVAARAPLAFRGWYLRPADQHPFCHEVVILPVADDDETVDHLFVVAA